MFSMKTHTCIHQMSCKMNRKYSQDIDEVRNNDFVLQTLLSSNNYPFAAITALQTFDILAVNLLRYHTYHTVKLLPQQLSRVEIW